MPGATFCLQKASLLDHIDRSLPCRAGRHRPILWQRYGRKDTAYQGLCSTLATALTRSLVEDLGADSLDLVELVTTMEEEFEIEISDEEAETLVTVQNAIDYIKANS